jgi:hypothetical protein
MPACKQSHTSKDIPVSDIHLIPNQPLDICFPVAIISGQKRQFQSKWFDTWKWLEWSQEKQKAVCHPCTMIKRLGKMAFSKNFDNAFTDNGFMNWKKGCEKFAEHEQSMAHNEAVLKWNAHLKMIDVSSMVHQENEKQQNENRAMLTLIMCDKIK